jgi:hypothetical protein
MKPDSKEFMAQVNRRLMPASIFQDRTFSS